jgi:hypothetical protein
MMPPFQRVSTCHGTAREQGIARDVEDVAHLCMSALRASMLVRAGCSDQGVHADRVLVGDAVGRVREPPLTLK